MLPPLTAKKYLFYRIALLGRLRDAHACLLDNRPTPRIRARRYAPRPARARVGEHKARLRRASRKRPVCEGNAAESAVSTPPTARAAWEVNSHVQKLRIALRKSFCRVFR